MKFTVDYREPEDNSVEVYTTPGFTTIIIGHSLEILITDKTAEQIVTALKKEGE